MFNRFNRTQIEKNVTPNGPPVAGAARQIVNNQTTANGQATTSAQQPIVAVKHVTKSFPVGDSEVTILNGVSLTVQPGEFVAIVGPSGNGKSTLLNMMTGIDRPSSGEVYVTSQPLHTMTENQMAIWRGEHLGIIFQFFQMLPSLSLVQNIILPMEFAGKYTRQERKERAMALLELVGLADQADKLPSMVSGGQQQRAAIARSLANDPPVIVGDEPTGNLDAKTANEVFNIFYTLVESGKTMLMVTHDRELAGRIPRVIEVRNGLIHSDTAVQ